MRILALDVSLRRSGIVVLDDGVLLHSSVILSPTGLGRSSQLNVIYAAVKSLMGEYAPDIVAIETSILWQRDGHDSMRTVEALAQARAAAMLAVVHAQKRAEIREVGVHEVREAICGYRRAGKMQVIENLRMRGYELPVDASGRIDTDVSDALCLGLFVWGQERLLGMKEVK